jgi:probable rRNA maturation factor
MIDSMNASIDVTVEIVNASSTQSTPKAADFQHWTQATLAAISKAGEDGEDPFTTGAELSIRLVDEAESAELNSHYRHKHGATNILSFPGERIQGTDINLLGDLAICASVVEREAAEQCKPMQAHWAHLTVHGVLHLNGFDHEQAADAERMEALEIQILSTLGFDNPYHLDDTGNE